MIPNYENYKMRKEEKQQERRDRFRMAAGMMEFLGVVFGVIVIFIMLALLFSLLNWLKQDIASTFSIILTRF